MNTESGKSPLTHFLLIGLAALAVRFLLLAAIGPQLLPDSYGYLEVSRNLAETGTFSSLDPATGKLAPFAMRVPVFHVLTAAIIKVFGPDTSWPFTFFNILLSSATVVLTAAFFYSLAGPLAGLLAGYLMAFNPNSIYYSLEMLPDTLFSLFVLLAAMIGLRAVRKGSLKWYLGWGAAIGLTTLVKPVFKYYWAVPLIIMAGEKTLREKALKKAAVLVLGCALVVGPWLARNYAELNFAGLELTFGVNTIWATTDLVRPSTPGQAKEDPVLASVRDIVAASREPMLAMTNVKTRLNMTDKEVNHYLFKIGREVMLKNPVKFSYRYVKNAVNFIVSGSSVVELSYKLLPGGNNFKSLITASIERNKTLPDEKKFAGIIKEAWENGTWPALVINVAARAACLMIFLVSAAGFILFLKTDRPGALVLGSLIAYFVLISAFTSGYDRYRLPIDPLLAGFFALGLGADRLKKWFGALNAPPTAQKGL